MDVLVTCEKSSNKLRFKKNQICLQNTNEYYVSDNLKTILEGSYFCGKVYYFVSYMLSLLFVPLFLSTGGTSIEEPVCLSVYVSVFRKRL